MVELSKRLEDILIRVRAAAQQSGRAAKDVQIIGVTKGVDGARIEQARAAGITILGENRVQEAALKAAKIVAEWHLIGHLQSNKVEAAVALFSMIQSVDSVRIAEKIGQASIAAGKTMPVLLEVNISGEKQKYGFSPEEIYGALETMKGVEGIEVRGLMGIAPNVPDAVLRRQSFRKLNSLYGVCRGFKHERFSWQTLSMGMSDDFEIAIEEGSNMVRLGRVIFGERA